MKLKTVSSLLPLFVPECMALLKLILKDNQIELVDPEKRIKEGPLIKNGPINFVHNFFPNSP
jgi:hypothetical protein